MILGDFNLDFRKKDDVNYSNADLFNIWDSRFDGLGLLQLVKFSTWSRMVGMTLRSSILDHIYVNDVTLVTNISQLKPIFGDHKLVMAELCSNRPQPKITFRRDWRHYSKDKLNNLLSETEWSNTAVDVQELWGDFETKLIKIVDELAPMAQFFDGKLTVCMNPTIKNKLNL